MSYQSKDWWRKTFVLSSFTSVRPGEDIEKIVGNLHALGLNTIESNTPLEYSASDISREEAIRVLEACAKHGMRFFVTDHRRITGAAEPSEESLKSLVQDYAKYPALAGYYVWDEPDVGQFGIVKKTMDTLQTLDPDHISLNAMLPSYGPYHHPKDYPDFIRRFVREVNPPVLCFDYYPVTRNDADKANPVSVSPEFYRDLDLWSKLSVETGKPLWLYIAACRWAHIAKPSPATLSLQAYTGIAYGVKGIIYFQTSTLTGGRIDFLDAALDTNGDPGPSFGMMQKLNRDIATLGPTLMTLKMRKVMHTDPIPAGCSGFEPGYESLQEASRNLLLAFHEDPMGRKYLIIVNKDVNHPQTAILRFDKTVALQNMRTTDEYPSRNGEIALPLPAGGAMVMRIIP